jgi:hypothetical protein
MSLEGKIQERGQLKRVKIRKINKEREEKKTKKN